MAARRENGVWVNDDDEIATIAVNADGSDISGLTVDGTAVSSSNPLPVDGGSPALAAAADALGTDSHRTAALDESPVVAVKAAAGAVYGYHLYNSHSAAVFVQFYDVAAGSVSPGTTTPKKTLAIPAGACLDTQMAVPWVFGVAISMAATSTATGGSAPGAAVLANVDYK